MYNVVPYEPTNLTNYVFTVDVAIQKMASQHPSNLKGSGYVRAGPKNKNIYIYIYTHTYIYIYIYISLYMLLFVFNLFRRWINMAEMADDNDDGDDAMFHLVFVFCGPLRFWPYPPFLPW